MGSEGPAAVTIHVTGFKKFHGVSENPTETIVSNLKEYARKKGLPKGVILGSCSVLETAGQGALTPLYQTFQSALAGKDSQSSSSEKIIWTSHPVEEITKALAKKGYEVMTLYDAGRLGDPSEIRCLLVGGTWFSLLVTYCTHLHFWNRHCCTVVDHVVRYRCMLID
ncbi:Peptidase C15, pyroglutamyl peptidase I-like isoform 1 [Hibiscus syriacus]|uniref:Peptidase C15, pyroglutamyl peptidase I-like isoform 1 n=1 Tax=Hibiscus syriacus TaxID=106335 RepID=A0A6A3AQD6_HIBSY|nr:Peptidase C15, pyroglutamyl peptidase I-like isoform 1 [Hibiscus syriacus]